MIDQASFDDVEARVEAPDDELSSDERFFVKLLMDLKVQFIRPQFTSDGVRYDSLSEFTSHYSTNEITQLLESLTNKGYLEKVDYGVVALCPSCQSPTHLTMLVCQRCGSTKVRKMEKIRHHDCGYWGEVGEFVDGFRLRCPSCGEPLNETTTGKDWSVSDPYYECQECGSVVSKDSMRHVCKRCRSVYTPSEASIKNPVGFKVLESRQEKAANNKGSRGSNLMESLLETIEVNHKEESLPDESIEEPEPQEPEIETGLKQSDDTGPIEHLEETPSTDLDLPELETLTEDTEYIEDETDHPSSIEPYTSKDDDLPYEKTESLEDSDGVDESVQVGEEGKLDEVSQDSDLAFEPTINQVDESIKNWLKELSEQNELQPITDGSEPLTKEVDFVEQEDLNSEAFGDNQTVSMEDKTPTEEEEPDEVARTDNEVMETEGVKPLEEAIDKTTDGSLSNNSAYEDLEDVLLVSSEVTKPPEQDELSPFDPWEDLEYILSMDPKEEAEEIDEKTLPETDNDIHKREEVIQEINIEAQTQNQETRLEETLKDNQDEISEETEGIEEISLLENNSEEKYLLTYIGKSETLEPRDVETSTSLESIQEESLKDYDYYDQIKTEPSETFEESVTISEDEFDHMNEDDEHPSITKDDTEVELENITDNIEDKEEAEIKLKTSSKSSDDRYSPEDDFKDYKNSFEATKEYSAKDAGKAKLNEDADEDYLDYLRAFGMIDEPDKSSNQREQDLEELFQHVENETEPLTKKIEEENEKPSPDELGQMNESPEIDEEDSYNAAFQDVEDFLKYVTRRTGKINKVKGKQKSSNKDIDVLTDQANKDMTEIVNTE